MSREWKLRRAKVQGKSQDVWRENLDRKEDFSRRHGIIKEQVQHDKEEYYRMLELYLTKYFWLF